MRHMEKMTGYKISTCPWRGYSDPVVSEVLEYRAMVGDGSISSLLVEDPPNHVIQGLVVYQHALTAIHNHDMEMERKRQKTAAPRHDSSRKVVRRGG